MVLTSDKRERLQAWLKDKLGLTGAVTLSEFDFPQGGTGNSADTTFAELRAVDAGRVATRQIAVRRQPIGDELFFKSPIDLPFNVMTALARYPSVPAPRAIALDGEGKVIGDPLVVSEKVDGRVVNQVPNPNLGGWVADLPPQQRRVVWLNALQVLANLHSLDWREGFGFLNRAEYGPPGLRQYLEYCKDTYEWARKDRDLPVMDAALKYLMENQPADAGVSVLWGDPAPYNIIYRPDLTVAAIVDFEMCALGPGEIDLAWWLNSETHRTTEQGVPLLEGLPSAEETLKLYAEFSGRAPRDMEYYRILAHFRGTACLLRLADRLVDRGFMPDGTDIATNNTGMRSLAEFLGLPLPPIGEGHALMIQGVQARIEDRVGGLPVGSEPSAKL